MQYRVKYDAELDCWCIEKRRFWPLPWNYITLELKKEDAIERAKRIAKAVPIRIKPTIYY